MKQLEFIGYKEGPYPSDAVDVDFSAGRMRGRPVPEQTINVPSGVCSALYYHEPSLNFIACINNTLYRIYSSSVFTLQSNVNIHTILPLGDIIVCIGSNDILLVDPSNWSVNKVAQPAKPSGSMAAAPSLQTTTLDQVNTAGNATVTDNTTYYKIDDATSDPTRGAWAEIYRNTALDEMVGYLICHLRHTSDDLDAATITAISASSTQHVKAIGAPVAVPSDSTRIPVPFSGKLAGIRVWVDVGDIGLWKQWQVVPEMKPRLYKVTRVDSNGWESEAVDVEVVDSGNCPHTDLGYAVYVSLPSGYTKRLYRQDALGYWRRVADVTGTSYTDMLPEEKLGDRLPDVLPPTAGGAAVLWQGRLCIAAGRKLYISAPSLFRFNTFDGGDLLEFDAGIYALVDAGSQLLIGTRSGWYELSGLPGAWVLRKQSLSPPVSSYSSSLPVMEAGKVIRVAGQDVASSRSLSDAVVAGNHLIIVTDQEWLVLSSGRWSRWLLPATRIVSVGNDVYYIHNAKLYKLLLGAPASRTAFSLSQKFPLPERGQLRWVHADGTGNGTVTVQGQTFASGNLPITSDWKRGEAWVLDLQLAVAAGGELYRCLVDVEALQVRR